MNAHRLVRSLLVVLCLAAMPVASYAGSWSVGISIGIPPPPLPVYLQPPCPAPGYIWTPGYWAYSDDDQDYYWVPGTWVFAPAPGLLWTPGYWAAEDAVFVWHAGYWGPHVGFYGGVDYGFGYFGVGFVGGYWHDHDFYYNRAAANVDDVRFTNVYNNTTVVNNFNGERASYNGPHGVHASPTGPELAASREPHHGWTAEQQRHAEDARAVPAMLARSNHGRPPIAATPRADVFHGSGVVAARSLSDAAPAPGRRPATGATRPASAFAPPAAGRSAGSTASWREHPGQPASGPAPARNDRPSWASPGRNDSASTASRWSSAPVREPAARQAHDATPSYRPSSAANRGGGAPSWQGRPAYSDATAHRAPPQAMRAEQRAPSERNWHPAPAPAARGYAAPPPPRQAGVPTPRYAAPAPRAAPAHASPPRVAQADPQRADHAHR